MLRPEILLHPQIPKPLHGLAPRTIKGQEWWDIQRHAAYARAGYCCLACGVPKKEAKYHQWLEGHELYEIDYKKGLMTFMEVVALCHSCHNFIHKGRMEVLVQSGEMEESKRRDILKHGNSVLKKAGVKPEKEIDIEIAPWGQWRLSLEGKEYKGKFRTFEDWMRFYAK